MSVLQVEGLVKRYGARRVVDGVALDVQPGEVVGLLGPNGAGKTTTFRMICGLLRPDSGTVQLMGEDVTHWPMHRRARDRGMGYLPQQSSVFAKLTARDNLIGIMQMLGFSRKLQRRRCEELLEQFQITHIARTRAGQLSGGERRRLEIARCLISNPKIIMLDEPFAGIDPRTVQNIQGIIRSLAEDGISILITDHAAREILQLTDRTYVVSEGRILVSGTADEIIRHEEVRDKYLGDLDVSRRVSVESASHAKSSEPEQVPLPSRGRRQKEPRRKEQTVEPATRPQTDVGNDRQTHGVHYPTAAESTPTPDERAAEASERPVDTQILKFHSSHVERAEPMAQEVPPSSVTAAGAKQADEMNAVDASGDAATGQQELPEVVFVERKRRRSALSKWFTGRKSG